MFPLATAPQDANMYVMTDEPDHLLFTRDGPIATITLNRPGALNALSDPMRTRLREATLECEQDPAIRCVVLKGNGKHFMAGGDVKSFHHSLQNNREAHLAGFEYRVVQAHQTIYQLRRMPKPVLACAQGGIAGFGFSLLVAADLAIVSDDALVTLAYRHIGLTPDGGASYFLPRLVGERRALEITLLGGRFDAAQAKDLGLVNWVVPRAELDERAAGIAASLAEGPTYALGMAKRLLRNSLDSSWDEQSHREAEAIAAAAASEDHMEGAAAFLEKRKAVFKGR